MSSSLIDCPYCDRVYTIDFATEEVHEEGMYTTECEFCGKDFMYEVELVFSICSDGIPI
jgi:uncharacterized Zn-finger protein